MRLGRVISGMLVVRTNFFWPRLYSTLKSERCYSRRAFGPRQCTIANRRGTRLLFSSAHSLRYN
jgi:hypothetical protein